MKLKENMSLYKKKFIELNEIYMKFQLVQTKRFL